MTPTAFYSIDPGLAATGGSGWARWFDRRLAACGVVRNKRKWRTVGQRIAGQREQFFFVHAPVVSESMVQRYGPGGRIIPPQDLIDLSLLSGALGTCWVSPTMWKGGVPSVLEQARTRHALDEGEMILVSSALVTLPKSVHKEVWSAVGIGLSVLGRAHRRCGWPLDC